MIAQPLVGELRIAGEDRLDNAFVLAKRRRQPVAHAQLQPAIRTQPPVQRGGLLGQEAVAAPLVDRVVEALVLIVVGIRIHRLAGALACMMRIEQMLMVGRGHPARGKPPA